MFFFRKQEEWEKVHLPISLTTKQFVTPPDGGGGQWREREREDALHNASFSREKTVKQESGVSLGRQRGLS
jgi:hypothetical protein